MPCASSIGFPKALNHLVRDEFADMCDAVLALEIKLGVELTMPEVTQLLEGKHPKYRAVIDTSGDLDEIKFFEGGDTIFVYTL